VESKTGARAHWSTVESKTGARTDPIFSHTPLPSYYLLLLVLPDLMILGVLEDPSSVLDA
jgi:hypothetical protein